MGPPARPDTAAALARARAAADERGRHLASQGRPKVEIDADLDEMQAGIGEAVWRQAVPRRFVNAHLGDFPALNKVLVDQLLEWAEGPAGRNVLIAGPVGTGKTHLAVGLARLLHTRGWAFEFCPVQEMLDQLRPGGPPGALERFCAIPLLVIDDLGAERPTDWTAERFGLVVNRRWLDELPTVYTSNLQPTELREHIGERTYSRITGGSINFTLKGDDRRRQP